MKLEDVGFYITRGIGFRIVFENGYVVSVQDALEYVDSLVDEPDNGGEG